MHGEGEERNICELESGKGKREGGRMVKDSKMGERQAGRKKEKLG